MEKSKFSYNKTIKQDTAKLLGAVYDPNRDAYIYPNGQIVTTKQLENLKIASDKYLEQRYKAKLDLNSFRGVYGSNEVSNNQPQIEKNMTTLTTTPDVSVLNYGSQVEFKRIEEFEDKEIVTVAIPHPAGGVSGNYYGNTVVTKTKKRTVSITVPFETLEKFVKETRAAKNKAERARKVETRRNMLKSIKEQKDYIKSLKKPSNSYTIKCAVQTLKNLEKNFKALSK